MSFSDAEAALNAAMVEDSAPAPAPVLTPSPAEQAPAAPTTPEGTQVPQVQPAQTQPVRDEFGRFTTPTPAEQPAPVQDTFDGGQFNPDTLPPELQPGWKQLQAAFTRKTQDLAAREQQFQGLDPQVAREAVELYSALQDPTYLQQFHQELTVALQQTQGLSPAQASAEAAQQMEQASAQPQGSVSDQLASLKADPELAPLAQLIEAQNARLESFETERAREREQQELASLQMAMAGELVRQESVLREQGLNQTDIDRVHELSPWHDGNLLKAAESYTQMKQSLISEYLDGKQVVEPGVGPLPGTSISTQPNEITDLNDALRAGLAQLEQAGINDLV